jgi:hypothetical protein
MPNIDGQVLGIASLSTNLRHCFFRVVHSIAILPPFDLDPNSAFSFFSGAAPLRDLVYGAKTAFA